MSDLEYMKTFAEVSGLAIDERALELLAKYRDLLLHYNKTTNLIGPMDGVQIEQRLLIDSLTAAATYAPTGSILDVGSGAGLPGIPLGIVYPELPVSLVEPRNKRVQFLQLALTRLGLDSSISVVKSQIETAKIDKHEYAVAKAFRAPAVWLEIALGLTTPEGVIVCMHGPNAELMPKADELQLDRIAYTESVKTTFGAHEGDVVRSVSVFQRKSVS